MTTIEQARAMIERLELEESAFYIAGDSDAASTVRGAMRCIQSLITALEQAEREALERAELICNERAQTFKKLSDKAIAEKAKLVWTEKYETAWNCAVKIRALITGKDKG